MKQLIWGCTWIIIGFLFIVPGLFFLLFGQMTLAGIGLLVGGFLAACGYFGAARDELLEENSDYDKKTTKARK